MFFEKQNAAITVVDVLHLETEKVSISHNTGRTYHAVTFRKKADTVLCYGEQEITLEGKSIIFIPENLNYIRKARNEEMIVILFLAAGEQTEEIKVYAGKKVEEYEELFEECLHVWKKKEKGYRLKAGELLLRILYQITVEEQREQDGGSVSSQAAELIRRNAENIGFSVTDLACGLGISGAHLRRLFKEEYGMTPKEYLTQYRLKQAKSLLQTGYFSVKEVAFRSGFGDEKYFATVFKKYCGIPPSRYEQTQWKQPAALC